MGTDSNEFQLPPHVKINDFNIDSKHYPAKLVYSTIDLIELILEGRDIVEHRKEYIEQILQLPFVDGNKLKATEVFHRMRKLQELLEAE